MTADPSGWAIVLTATAGMEDFTYNAVAGLRRVGVDLRDVHLILNDEAAEWYSDHPTLRFCNIIKYHDLLSPSELVLPNEYAIYGSEKFSHVMSLRVPLLLSLLRGGRNVLFSDVDVGWIRSPLEYLDQALKWFPMAMQTEAVAVFPPVYCMGFMALSPRAETFNILESFQQTFVQDREINPRRSMQATFHDLLTKNPRLVDSIFPLPESHFCNGLVHRLAIGDSQANSVLEGTLEPFIVHANFTRGLANKRALLKQCGLWDVSLTALG